MKPNVNSFCKTVCLAMLIFILQAKSVHAQSRFEVGFIYGPSNFLGDLGGNSGKGGKFLKDNVISLTRYMTGFHVGYHPYEFINFDVSFSVGKVEAADSLIKGKGGYEEARKNRNLHFRSPIKEMLLTAEVFPTTLIEYDMNNVAKKVRPYFILGVGVFKFNPQAQYTKSDGSKVWVDLKPLRTEGQGMPNHPDRKEYSLTELNIPYGFGVKYFASENTSISIEIVTRKTFTDYIDDVSTNYIDNNDFYSYFGPNSEQAIMAIQMANRSNGIYGTGNQRGTPKNHDSYYSSSLKICFRIKGNTEPRQLTPRGSASIRCPRF